MNFNKIKTSSYILSASILFLSIFLLNTKTISSSNLVWSTWSFSEFLISYPDNIFVRRGLLGEIFLFLANGGPALNIIQNYVFYNFVLFIFLSTSLFFAYKVPIERYFLFLISSYGYLNLISYNLSYHRKEILFFNFFLIFLLLIKFQEIKLLKMLIIPYVIVTTILTCLIHEGMLLIFLPFYYLIIKKEEITFFNLINFELFYLAVSIIAFFLVVLNKGTQEISNAIFSDLHPEDSYLLKDYTVDGIRAIGWSLKRGLILPFRILLSGTAFYWLYILFLQFFTLFIVLYNFEFSKFKNNLIKFHKEYPVIYISYLIFFIGWDWGRWFIIIFYLYLFSFMYDHFKSGYKYKNNFKLPLLVLYIIFSVFTIIPECCLSWTHPEILNNIERYFGEIKINY